MQKIMKSSGMSEIATAFIGAAVPRSIFLVGAFPPPIHGMAAVNAIVKDALFLRGNRPVAINVAARNLERSLSARLGRLPKIVGGLLAFATARGLRGGTLYMSVSGGTGQVYEAIFALLGRMRGMRLFLHHHSFGAQGQNGVAGRAAGV